MSSSILPSLKELTMIKVSLIIYSCAEFREVYNRLRDCNVKKPFQKAKEEVFQNYSYILPYTLYTDMHCRLEHINKQVMEFSRECCIQFDDVNSFCWRSNGELDRSRTVKTLVQNPKMQEIFYMLSYIGVIPTD